MAEQPAAILMVDDEVHNLDLLEALLLPQGYRLRRAKGGEEALAAVAAERPDLILLDVMMPHVDGFEVCRRLKADAGTRFIPVVMVTSLRDLEDRLRGIEVGADDFLSKPVNRHELLSRVRACLRLGYYRHLAEERARFDAVVAELRDGIVVCDAAFRVASSNRAALALLDLTEEGWTGRDLLEHLGRAFQSTLPLPGLREGRDRSVDFELSRPGKSFPLTLAARLTRTFGPDGGPETVALVVRDVTEQRREERLKGDFLSLMSHKFKTPITVIAGYVALLLRGQLGALTDRQREAMEGMTQKTEELERLVDRLLTFSALSGADLTRQREMVRADAVLARVTERLAQRYPDRKLAVTTEVPADPPLVAADPRLLEMAWENLMDNAVKFSDKTEAVLRIGMVVEGGTLRCWVADNGPGLPHEKAEEIFQPFSQLEASFTGNVEGVGLGLPLVRRIVEAHGGRIWVESRIGAGSTFFFTFPLSPGVRPAS
ncbi:MAG: response regulator [candidate division NC10 bacterium]|nr:response regulator [candidate division NC10 bacterium]